MDKITPFNDYSLQQKSSPETVNSELVYPNVQPVGNLNAEPLEAAFRFYEEVRKDARETQKKVLIAKIKEDINFASGLRREWIIIGQDGQVILGWETFGGNQYNKLDVEVIENVLYRPIYGTDEGVLKINICDRTRKNWDIWLNLECMNEKMLKDKFIRKGFSFGFSQKKESEILRLFISAIIDQASTNIRSVPLRHGWYQVEGRFCYAYPEELVWKEVLQNAK